MWHLVPKAPSPPPRDQLFTAARLTFHLIFNYFFSASQKLCIKVFALKGVYFASVCGALTSQVSNQSIGYPQQTNKRYFFIVDSADW
jgi:hypothetical protein